MHEIIKSYVRNVDVINYDNRGGGRGGGGGAVLRRRIHKLRRWHWLFPRSADSTANENDVILYCLTYARPKS